MLKNIIIIDNQSYPLGGTAQVAFTSAVELQKRGYNVVYISADKKPNPELIKSGIDIKTLYNPSINRNSNKLEVMTKGLWNNKMKNFVSDILSSFSTKDTIIHIHGYLHCFSPSILKSCKQSKIKTILTLHDYFMVCPCGGFYNHQKHKICTLIPMSLKCLTCNCDKRSYIQKIWRIIRQRGIIKYARDCSELRLIYISDYSYSKMRNILEKKHKVYYVRNPYDIGKGEIYTSDKAHDYLFVGRLSEEKGVDVFCNAFSNLIKNNIIKGKAIVVGDGELRGKFEKEYPLITFVGWKTHDQFNELFLSSRALIFPSRWYEGAPLTPIEFMSHGIPCIISDSNSGKDYITDGKDGIIFKSENVEDLIQKVKKCEDDIFWSRICINLRESFNPEEYSVYSHVNNLLNVYNEIIEE